jgi:hypothetical protein
MSISPTLERKNACVALVGLDVPTREILSRCFREFGLDSRPMRCDEVERMHLDPYAGCVLCLNDGAARVLEIARSGPANFQMVIYGLAASMTQALRFSRYGINAILDEPLDEEHTMRVLRATYLFVSREVRRYVRVPLITIVTVYAEGRKHIAKGEEISSGGMSIDIAPKLPVGLMVEVELSLPNVCPVRIPASVRWVRNGRIGVRFDEHATGRQLLKAWTERFLGSSG